MGRTGPRAVAGNNGILDLIGRLEAPQGYNQVYGGSRLMPPRPLENMTVAEVMDWQRRSVRAGSRSSAAGRYQIIGSTLQSLVNQGAVGLNDQFDRNTQDNLATVLMERRGLSNYKSGQITAQQFGNNLAKEWASLPVQTGRKAGRSYYDGDGLNHALTTPQAVLAALQGGVA